MDGLTPSVSSDKTVRDEGIAAHYMAEQVYKGAVTIEEMVDRKAPNGVYMTDDMAEYVQYYLDCLPDVIGQMEVQCDHSGTGYQVNGRADFRCATMTDLHIVDFKYGWSIVEPEMNWTLISHAIATVTSMEQAPEKIIISICQPRPYHRNGKFRSWEITCLELFDLASRMQFVLSNPTDQLLTSDHCKRCEGLAGCPAAHKASMNAIDVADKAFNDTLPDEHLSNEIDVLRFAQTRIKNRLQAIEELAMHRIKSGQPIKNYIVEQGYGHPKWNDGVTPETLSAMTGKAMSKPKILTPGQAKKAGLSEAVIKTLSTKPKTSLKLTRASANETAEKLFGKTSTKGT